MLHRSRFQTVANVDRVVCESSLVSLSHIVSTSALKVAHVVLCSSVMTTKKSSLVQPRMGTAAATESVLAAVPAIPRYDGDDSANMHQDRAIISSLLRDIR